MNPDNPYTRMQREFYAKEAAKWSPDDRDHVVGSWDEHEAWQDYDLLFEGIDTAGMTALDFGCGPGRMIVRYARRFKQIDGVDIVVENLDKAREYCEANGVNKRAMWLTTGVDLGGIPDALYDLVYSTICLQHIPVHEIRLNLFREFCRVLKPGGWFTAQMGFGGNGDPRGVDYYANKYGATTTNGGCDVKVTDETELMCDLVSSGFDGESFSFTVCPAGPNDWHPNWVFFRARKPGGL